MSEPLAIAVQEVVVVEPPLVVTEPAVVVTEPVLVAAQVVTAQVVTEPVVVVTEKVFTEPVVVVTEQVVTEPVLVAADPVVLVTEPVITKTEPVVVLEKVMEPLRIVIPEETIKAVFDTINLLEEKAKKDMNLSEMLTDFLKADNKGVELTPKIKQMIALLPLIKSNHDPTNGHLANAEVLFNKILADGEINVNDMYDIIGLLREMYLIYDTMKLKVSAEEVEKVFKLLIQIFVEYKLDSYTQIPDDKKDLIVRTIDTILTLSTQLIDLKSTRKKKLSYFTCFF